MPAWSPTGSTGGQSLLLPASCGRRFCCFLTASILAHRVDIAVVLAALFLFGVNETFGDTTTATLLPMLAGNADLGIANSRAVAGVIVWNQMAGPPVGGALFAAGMALPFASE